MPLKIQSLVGDRERLISHELFLFVHGELADYYREQGLTGHALDCAIVEALPHRLAQFVSDASNETQH